MITLNAHERAEFTRCAQAMLAANRVRAARMLTDAAAIPDGGSMTAEAYDIVGAIYRGWLVFNTTSGGRSMSTSLKCSMTRECVAPVTHLDEKGFVYCAGHGTTRASYCRCRTLAAHEIRMLVAGTPISYARKRNRAQVAA